MNEQSKIGEARHFLNQMRENRTREEFFYVLSAFVSAARSSLQYACKEATSKTGGRTWYDQQVTNKEILKFFRDARDLNIHERPVTAKAALGVNITAIELDSASLPVAIIHSDGTLEEPNLPSPPWLASERLGLTVTKYYFFQDWPGSEEVVELCDSYLAEVEQIVADGITKGFLTP